VVARLLGEGSADEVDGEEEPAEGEAGERLADSLLAGGWCMSLPSPSVRVFPGPGQ
jgi:hypothetical protein